MKRRSPFAVFFLPWFTFGIYSIYWLVQTKVNINKLGGRIPTAWLVIVPLVNLWWFWRYCEEVEEVTEGGMSMVVTFLLLVFLANLGQAIVQSQFNDYS